MHDATEAYCGDMIKPLKRQLPAYKAIEDGIWKVIAAKYGLPEVLPATIKEIDMRMLSTERREIIPASMRQQWRTEEDFPPYPLHLGERSTREVEKEFLEAFRELHPEYLNQK